MKKFVPINGFNVLVGVLLLLVGGFGGSRFRELLERHGALRYQFSQSFSIELASYELGGSNPTPCRSVKAISSGQENVCNLVENGDTGYTTPVYVCVFGEADQQFMCILNKWTFVGYDVKNKCFVPVKFKPEEYAANFQRLGKLNGILVFPSKGWKPKWKPRSEVTSAYLKAQGLPDFCAMER